MKIEVPGCRWERRVPPTTRDNSVQLLLKEILHIFALLCLNHTDILLNLLNTLVKKFPFQITEHEKSTWMPLGKACPSNDARQQRARLLNETLHIFALLCHYQAEIF